MAKKSVPASPNGAATPNGAEPPTLSLADNFLKAGVQALEQVLGYLELQIDKKQLVDPEWLRDPENRKIAAVLMKAAAIQTNVALGIISGQIRLGTQIKEDVEKERRRQLTLSELARKLRSRAEGEGAAEPLNTKPRRICARRMVPWAGR